MPHDKELYIGMMSGTSVDGIDTALVSISSASEVQVIETQFTAFSPALRKQINSIAQKNNSTPNTSDNELHASLAQHYAQASLNLIEKAGIQASEVRAIANHGQTVRHAPNASPPFSIQLGNPQEIANQTKIPTIGYFRQADLASGGQGAPLMPAFHKAVLCPKEQKSSYILNIGGIANITQLNNNVVGFDTGPGNTLLDQWVQHHQNKSYDKDGAWAKTGQCIPQLLKDLLKDPYFSSDFPKSTGPDYFNLGWLKQLSPNIDQYNAVDVQATLLSLTIESIADSFRKLTNEPTFTVLVCGGGAHNTSMMQQLSLALQPAITTTTDSVGIPPDWVEAAGFAWLGYCRVHGIKSNLPSVTGAKKAVVLGELFLPEAR